MYPIDDRAAELGHRHLHRLDATLAVDVGVQARHVGDDADQSADAVVGLVTTWDSSDKLDMFHQYLKGGTTMAMQSLNFKNASSTGSNAAFVYNGSEYGYSFNPGKELYAFNKLPVANNYTVTYRSSTDDFLIGLIISRQSP